MALARKCDVCGKFYKLYGDGADSPNHITWMYIDEYDDDYPLDSYDLCPDCKVKIESFIDSLKPKEDTSETL